MFFFDVYTFSKEYYAAFTTYTSNPIEWLIQPLQAIARVALDGVRYFYNPLHALNTLVPLVLLLALVTIRKTAPRRFVLPLVVGALLIAPKPDFTFFLWFPNVSALHGAALYFVIALLCGLLFQAMSETKFFLWKTVGRFVLILYGLFVLLFLPFRVIVENYLYSSQKQLNESMSYAPIMQELLTANDYYWAGPYIEDDVLRIEAKPAASQYFYYPWQASCPSCRARLLRDLTMHSPKVVFFQYDISIWGNEVQVYASDLLDCPSLGAKPPPCRRSFQGDGMLLTCSSTGTVPTPSTT